MKKQVAVAIASLTMLAAVASAAAQGVTITFTTDEVVVTGVSPGAPTAIFAVGNEPGPYYRTLLRRERLVTADQQGRATYSIPGGASPWSLWFAADTRTADYTLGSPSGTGFGAPMPPPTVAPDASGADDIEFDADFAFVFVVQRGSGAWVTTLAKGSAQDLTPGGKMRVRTSSLHAFDKSSARPGHLTPADLLVIVNPHTMQYYAGRAVSR